jgi:sortase A
VRRLARILGTVMIVGGILTLGWAVLVWQWQDPFTAVYTHYEQGKLGHKYAKIATQFEHTTTRAPSRRLVDAASLAAEQRQIARQSRRYRKSLHEGDPVGRLRVPRLGLKIWLVNGTDESSLEKGPGRYLGSYMPGEGQLVYVAGHRTTYLAPFSHIDSLRPGDPVTIQLPFATFDYVVTNHVIVPADDLSVLKSHGREVLALQACHPRFFATHRYIAYAKLVRVIPKQGHAYAIEGNRLVAA